MNRAPVTPIIYHDNIHLRVDATYFKQFCVVCYQDYLISYTQLFRFSDAERYEEIKEDLNNLLTLGLQIASITCDGHKAILKAIKKIMPSVIVQRCLVHIQRMGLLWLTANPTYDAGKELRNIGFDDTSHRNAQRLAILDAKFISMGNQIQRLPERKILQT